MIAFTCKQCGKSHSRPEEASGTLVFCECGQGNRVPWVNSESQEEISTLSPVEDSMPAAVLPPEENRPIESELNQRQTRWQEAPIRDLSQCLNHPDSPGTQPCAACQEGFCEDCVIIYLGETLCGPCKNFRIRYRQKGPTISILAITSLIAALVGVPMGFLMLLSAIGAQALDFGWVGLIPMIVALVLGMAGLRQIESRPRLAGRALALSGIVTALGGIFLLAVVLVSFRRNIG